MAVMGALGVLAAVGVAAGDDDMRACVDKRSGVVREAGEVGHCTAREAAITISGDAFKAGRYGTITLNGVSLRKGRRGGTITLNGVGFQKGSRGNTLTINGVSFRKGRGNTLTINGTEFTSGSAKVQGERGPTGPAGPQGPPGVAGSAANEVAGPVAVSTSAGATQLVTGTFSNSDGRPHRLLLAGGFSAECTSCGLPVRASWSLSRADAGILVRRRMPHLDASGGEGGASVSEVVTSPDVCAPCTYALSLTATIGAGGDAQTVNATDIRLAVVDLGIA